VDSEMVKKFLSKDKTLKVNKHPLNMEKNRQKKEEIKNGKLWKRT
jgi:hypothetical protein